MSDAFREALEHYAAPRFEGYEVLRVLGDGGQARVYLARREDGLEVAVKRWLEADRSPEVAERVRREVQALEQVEHPNLVAFLDTTQDDQGAPCLVTEFVEGTSLAALIRQAGRLEPDRAAQIGVALAAALGCLHSHGLVHRDVKPSNVLIRTRDNQPVLIDLGIVKAAGPGPEPGLSAPLTQPGRALGTYPYMAPEQLGGETARELEPQVVDGRVDLYGLGALLFEAATGFPPWTDQGPWVRRNRSPWDDPVYPEVRGRAKDVPRALRRIIGRCLRGDPDLRPPSAETLQAELEAFRAGRSLPALPEDAAPPFRRMLTLAFVRLAEPPEAFDEANASRQAAHRQEVRRCAEAADGVELGAEGGEFCFSFEAPSSAVAFALRLLAGTMPGRTAPGRTAPDSRGEGLLPVRIGIQLGEVCEGAGAGVNDGVGLGVAGPAVEHARLLSYLAQPSQALLSAGVFNEARGHLRVGPGLEELAWQAYGPYQFDESGPGDGAVLEVCEVGLPGVSPLTPPPESQGARRCLQPGAETVLGWRPARGLHIPKRLNWRLSHKLGEGGFGEVWLATHTTTGDERAFKFCFQASRLRQLKREVILFTILRDTLDKRWDIAQLLDWQFEEAPYFIESEYSPNGSFLDWARARGGLCEIPFEQRIELIAQVADALGAAHRVGVLHKDVKPSNVLITSYGAAHTAQLADFGVGMLASRESLTQEVRLVSRQITSSGLTEMWAQEEGRAFTHLYVAPELIEGQAASQLSDIYALGVMLYQVVRGDFSKAIGTGWERYVKDPLLRDDVAACVDSDPARRLPCAEDLAQRLRSLEERRQDRGAREREEGHRELLRRHEELVRQRKRWLLLVTASVAVALWGLVWPHLGPGREPASLVLQRRLQEEQRESESLRQRIRDLEQEATRLRPQPR